MHPGFKQSNSTRRAHGESEHLHGLGLNSVIFGLSHIWTSQPLGKSPLVQWRPPLIDALMTPIFMHGKTPGFALSHRLGHAFNTNHIWTSRRGQPVIGLGQTTQESQMPILCRPIIQPEARSLQS